MNSYYAMNDNNKEEILCNTNFSNLKIAGLISMNYGDYYDGVDGSGFVWACFSIGGRICKN